MVANTDLVRVLIGFVFRPIVAEGVWALWAAMQRGEVEQREVHAEVVAGRTGRFWHGCRTTVPAAGWGAARGRPERREAGCAARVVYRASNTAAIRGTTTAGVYRAAARCRSPATACRRSGCCRK